MQDPSQMLYDVQEDKGHFCLGEIEERVYSKHLVHSLHWTSSRCCTTICQVNYSENLEHTLQWALSNSQAVISFLLNFEVAYQLVLKRGVCKCFKAEVSEIQPTTLPQSN